MSTTHPDRNGERGFAVATAVFILVALAALAGGIVLFTAQTSVGQAMDVSGSRAYQAARAGIEWGAYQVLDPYNATATSGTAGLPACPGGAFPSSAFSGTVLAPYAVTVTCASADYVDQSRKLRIYTLTSTATSGADVATVERQISARVPYCRDPNGSASAQPPYGCN